MNKKSTRNQRSCFLSLMTSIALISGCTPELLNSIEPSLLTGKDKTMTDIQKSSFEPQLKQSSSQLLMPQNMNGNLPNSNNSDGSTIIFNNSSCGPTRTMLPCFQIFPSNASGEMNNYLPRLDDITLKEVNFQNGNPSASGFFMVHGANIQAGDKIYINGVEQPTMLYNIYNNSDNLNATIPDTLGYPIFQYATLWSPLDNLSMGTDIHVKIKKSGGGFSNELTYHLATDSDELDSDGDGLLDHWEINGYDANNDGVIDVDLPALGADPFKKDLFVEVDWMQGLEPHPNFWAHMNTIFANAPVLNSDGTSGISLHLDHGSNSGGGGGSTIPSTDFIRYDDITESGNTYTNFYDAKAIYFDPHRLKIFRYAIFAYDSGHSPGSSGRAEGIWSNDFFVSLGSSSVAHLETYQTSTFLHELGHTLNLRHGGDENNNRKDNYNSVMNYGNEGSLSSPSQFGGIDTNCNMSDIEGIFNFSQGQRRNLDENQINENQGVCDNIPVDFNQNQILESNLQFNLDTISTLEEIHDHADWANLQYKFDHPTSQWGNN